MAVQTPKYWQREEFQPLTEETTVYGNKVLIPKSLQNIWKKWESLKGKYPQNIERAKAAGFFERPTRKPINKDIMRVFYEQYHE